MPGIFFQIGTNNGNDIFRDKVKSDKPSLIILVEPNKSLISDINNNYKDIENVHIFNNAIYYNNNEDIELYIPKNKGYSTGHFSLLPMNDWGKKDAMEKFVAKSITFDEICRQHGITDIDFLQIDTEGFDSEIIKMIDFNKYNIKQIRFEKWGFDTSCFTRHHSELSNELGVNGMNTSIEKLKGHNYSIHEIKDRSGNDIIATKI